MTSFEGEGPHPDSELAAGLRTPLSEVEGHARMLLDRADPGDFVLRARLDGILAAARRMRGLIEGLSGPHPNPRPAAGADGDRLLVDLRREFQDADFIAELVQTWADSAATRADALRGARAARERRGILAGAHALKAPARTVGAHALAARLVELERRAEDAPWEELDERLDQVLALLPEVVRRLQELVGTDA